MSAGRRSARSHAIRFILSTAVVAVAVAFVWPHVHRQWDLETYYFAATAHHAGLNPYSLEALTAVAGKTVALPFLYPPVTLAFFAPLAWMPLAAALWVWLALKVVLAAGLIWIWKHDFLPGVEAPLLLAGALIGFELSLPWDLRTGNVALLETFLLWTAFASYLRGRLVLAAYLIALASMFKLLPIALLGILAPAPGSRRERWGPLGAAVVLFVVAVSVPLGLAAEWRRALLHAPPAARILDGVNPSVLGLAQWLFASGGMPSAAVPYASVGSYLALATTLLLLSVAPMRRLQAADARLEQVVLLVLVWLLVAPRAVIYSYPMAVVPMLYVLRHRIALRAWRFLAVGLWMAPGLIRLLPGPAPPMLGAVSFPILLAAWILFVRGSPAPVPR